MEATIVREYGPFEGIDKIGGLTYDGERVWFAVGDRIVALDPNTGAIVRTLDVPGHAGTAFDGKHLYQVVEDRIQKVDPASGRVLATIPSPGKGGDSGLAWAEGSLWVGHYRERKIYQIDPGTGAILRTVVSNRFVTGVTWVEGELWHATWEGEQSELRRVGPGTGEVLASVDLPEGVFVSGLESDGKDRFYCASADSGKVRAVRRPGKPAVTER